jgi:FkbM family methyltransferase
LLEDIVIASGRWEQKIREILDSHIEEDHVIVDIGAYIGDKTIPLSRKVSKIIAFEPNPQTSNILKKNIEINNLRNVKLETKPVSNEIKKVQFHLSNCPMNSSINNDRRLNDNYSSTQVETIDLDTSLANENRVDWLLIDTEGQEIGVLRGAKKVLQKFSPRIILEVMPENLGEIKELLSSHGYSIRDLNFFGYFFASK